MTLRNQLFDERLYPATNSLFLKNKEEKIFLGFKVDPETKIVLDCKWKTNATETTRERLSLFSEEVIGYTFAEAQEMTLKRFSEFHQ